MIYCFSLHSTLKADPPPHTLHFYVFLTVRRGPNREGGDPAERRVLQKDPQPCQRGGQTDGEPAGEKRTIHHSAHRHLVTERQLAARVVWRPPEVCAALKTAVTACPPPHFLPQTLKDYQRRLDTSGLKPSNELYTEYKVSQQTCSWHLLCCQYTLFLQYVEMNSSVLSRTLT